MTFQDLADWYLEEKQTEADLVDLAKAKGKVRKGPGKNYLARLRSFLKSFNKVFGHRLTSDFASDDLKRYCHRCEVDLSPYWLDIEMAIVRSMVNAAFDSDKVDAAALKALRKVKSISTKDDRKRTRALSIEEYLRLIDVAPQHLRAMIVIGMNTGMRVGEIRQLEWAHVDRKTGVFRLPWQITKTKQARAVPMSEEVVEAMSSLPRHLHGYAITFKGSPLVVLAGVKADEVGLQGSGPAIR